MTVVDAPAQVRPVAPYNREAEESVLGSVLINPEAIKYVAWLRQEDFYIQRNGFVWKAMNKLDEDGVAIDLITLGEEIAKMNLDVEPVYLTSLINQVPTSLNIEHYARIVKDYAQRRIDVQIANELATGAYSARGTDRAHIVDMLTKNTGQFTGAACVADLLKPFYMKVEERSKNPRDIWGISTGISSLDKATGGLQKQQTTILAGSPGVGKTTLMIQFILQAARSGAKCAVYELEMDTYRLLCRMISMLVGVPIRDINSGRMENHWENFNRGIEMLEKLNLYICDNPVMNTSQVRADVARVKALHGLDFVGLDYLNLLTDHDSEDDNKNTTAKAVRFRQTCREFDVAGLSVQSITKEGMRSVIPQLADMSGPAEVGFSADNVFFMVEDADNKSKFMLLPAKMRDSDSGKKPIHLIKPQGKIIFGEPVKEGVK